MMQGLKYLKKSTAHVRTKARCRRKNFFDPYIAACEFSAFSEENCFHVQKFYRDKH